MVITCGKLVAKPDSESVPPGNKVIFINFPSSGFKSLSLSALPSGSLLQALTSAGQMSLSSFELKFIFGL